MTYVHARIALAALPAGGVLQIRLRGRDAEASVPANARRQGHGLIGSVRLPGGDTLLWLRRG